MRAPHYHAVLMPELNATLDPKRRSWVDSANAPGCDFSIQNLPFGVFIRDDLPNDASSHIGVAIGDSVFDITQALEIGILDFDGALHAAFVVGVLNEFMSLGKAAWSRVRSEISELLRSDNPRLRDDRHVRSQVVVPMNRVKMGLPAHIGDYTDFYASIHHASNVGSMFRPDNPLLPNYKYLPVGYHGRASSIVVSGTPIRRPMGQIVSNDTGPPEFAACKLLDYEMELGFFVGPGNDLGTRIGMAEAREHIFGMVIVNDWSARDIQKWEYQPLGPFNAKNFATTISPWVVTMEALEPVRIAGPLRDLKDPPVLDYLKPREECGYDITVEVRLTSKIMRERGMPPMLISQGSFAQMYWTIAQMLVHHTSTGCNLQPGDLLASGTISGPTSESRGCLLERTWRGRDPLSLPDGTQRKFLQDGDEVIMTASAQNANSPRIGLGECRGIVVSAC
jgi:fumarylacetoacetase